jgi:hypothetical protein
MTYVLERNTLQTRFNTQWAAATKIKFANVDDSSIPPKNAAWVEFSILTGESDNIGVGTTSVKLHRAMSIIDIGIFVPKGGGVAAADVYADTAAAIFRNWSDATSGIVCYSPYKTVVGESGEYFQINVTIPFRRDEAF